MEVEAEVIDEHSDDDVLVEDANVEVNSSGSDAVTRFSDDMSATQRNSENMSTVPMVVDLNLRRVNLLDDERLKSVVKGNHLTAKKYEKYDVRADGNMIVKLTEEEAGFSNVMDNLIDLLLGLL